VRRVSALQVMEMQKLFPKEWPNQIPAFVRANEKAWNMLTEPRYKVWEGGNERAFGLYVMDLFNRNKLFEQEGIKAKSKTSALKQASEVYIMPDGKRIDYHSLQNSLRNKQEWDEIRKDRRKQK
jgi:hypothetical protein